MKRSMVLIAALLAGCAMTPTQKKVTGTVVAIVVIGAIASHHKSSEPPPVLAPPGGLPCRPQPDGSCR